MKIAIAQTHPVTGDIDANIIDHVKWSGLAATQGAHLIVFPELSLTGYEPSLAHELSTHPFDERFDVLQCFSDTNRIAIAAGAPLMAGSGVNIGLVIFQPAKARQIYSKQSLHPDEYPYFARAANSPLLSIGDLKVGLAICYELSVPEHLEMIINLRPDCYVASVAKTKSGIEEAHVRLREIASNLKLPVLVVNCIGLHDGMECHGKSAIFDRRGERVTQLDADREGLLIFETSTSEVFVMGDKAATTTARSA